MNDVEAFWTGHTVRDEEFTSAEESFAHLDWRSKEYPLFHELMGLWGDHSKDVVLDFGCGPGNDLVGFLVHGNAKEVIGVDISATSLRLARKRLGLHGLSASRYTLIKSIDTDPWILLPDASVNHIYSQGVLHHTSNPGEILDEFHRILRPGGTASIMVYNYDSLYLHLYVAYRLQILQGRDPGLTIEKAFQRNTDGDDCPISIPYRPFEFFRTCQKAGFDVDFLGGYFNWLELDLWASDGQQAMADERLGEEHRSFLRSLVMRNGYPTLDGLPAGIGGVYRLTR
jgi:SAM-dependent methyltransferase